MPFDGSVVYSVAKELSDRLMNGKVEKIYQPEKDELIFSIRSFKETHKLLISSSPMYPRLHLTEKVKSNPLVAPSFCMLLRKHLSGARISSIIQPQLERIVEITFDCTDDMGYSNKKTIVVEIMGRHSNIIFIDCESRKIIDCIKRVNFQLSSVREILPGKEYVYPPSAGKQNISKLSPLTLSLDSLKNNITSLKSSIRAEKFFVSTYNGISPIVSREICARANVDSDSDLKEVNTEIISRLFNSFNSLIESLKNDNTKANIVINQQKPIDFSCYELTQYNAFEKKYFESISKTIEYFYQEKDAKDRLRQRYSDIHKIINNRLERCYKKFEKLNDELLQAHNADTYKIYGDLLTSNIHNISKGDTNASVQNYYSGNNEYIDIPLDIQLTPVANSQRFYKLYNKAKNALILIDEQIKDNYSEIKYLESQLDNLEKCTEELEISEIRNELIEQGYINKRKLIKSKKKQKSSSPMHFISSSGFDVYVGKNNVQNDYLTLKLASSYDIWLHTKDIPGSHVIIKCSGSTVDDITLEEAANLAAFYSKAKESVKVPIDYTIKKNVKKPNGSKPGMVIYDNYKTVYIDPNEETIKKMKKTTD